MKKNFIFSWHVSSIIMLFVNIFLSLLSLFLVKSPYEAARKNNYDQTSYILSKLRNKKEQNVQNEVNKIRDEIEGNQNSEKKTIIILKNLNKKNVYILFIIFSMTQLCGLSILTTYMVDIFSSTNIDQLTLLLLYGISNIASSFLQMVIADKFGR